MSSMSAIARRLAAGLAVLCLGAGLATAVAGAAQAAVPSHWGFAFVDKPNVAGTPELSHQAGSWPSPLHAHVTHNAAKTVFVHFPRIASKAGIVHVTAVIDAPVWCQAEKWRPAGVNEIVAVRCYKAGGTAVFAPFTVMFTESSKAPFPAGRAYGYVRFRPGHGIVTRFNSAGAANTVTAAGTGVWVVAMPGLGAAARAGGVQVTAVNPTKPAKCQVSNWASTPARQLFRVRCYNGAATPVNTGWTLSYQRRRAITGAQPKLFAYTFDNKPLLAGPYAPVPPAVNFNSAGGSNSIRSAGTGLRLVTFPHVGELPNNVLVSGFHTGAGFCNLLSVWGTSTSGSRSVLVRDVGCYTASGVTKGHAALITYTGAH
jgi:hypothetical protein